MKNIYLLTLTVLISFSGFSQIGINTTTPNPSSVLDISSNNKGVLFPRVSLSGTTDNSTIHQPVEGLFVYNTATTADVTPGFYFWKGGNWTHVEDASSSSNGGGSGSNDVWSLSGNNVSSNDFLGTTNWSSLQFKVNNSQMALFHPNGGMALGYNAVANNNNSVAIGTGANASASNQATALGASSTASGFQSAALGYNAKAITGNSTLALGNSATASSFQATAIGVNAKANSSNNALAIGTNSEATGENSSALGTNSTASGQNAMAVGYGANASQPNTLILGNDLPSSNWAATKVGIGMENPSEKLEVKGNVKIVQGSLKIQDGNLQIVDGTQGAGKVLTSDSSGNTSWQDVSSSSNVAYADIYASSSQQLNSATPIRFGNIVASENIAVNDNNVQVLQSGMYKITYGVGVIKTKGGSANIEFKLTKGWNSSVVPGTVSYAYISKKDKDKVTATATRMVHLNAYQQVYLFNDANSNDEFQTIEDTTYMTIELIKAD